ncbi:MAG: hypothetical protein JXA93_10915 [Anaerolineae bacterium]|nr:hypothetical protein [Anaerolineae bacterium]
MERTFLGVFSGCLAFLLAGGTILFLGWLLWWLWSRQHQEEKEPAVEIELDATDSGRGGVVVGVEEEVVASMAEEALPPEPPRGEVGEPGATRSAGAVEVQPVQSPPVVESKGSAGPDDLRVIEGIGPRIASVLRAGGIHTFRDLADAKVAHIEEILAAADPRLLRLCKPDTWPEQAALAAAGDWTGLEALTDQLKGGRRV